MVVALALVLGFVAVELSTVTAAVIVGAIAASMLEPMARRLRARGLSPGIASAVACAIGLGALFLIIAFLALALVPSIGEIVSAVREGVDDVRAQLAALGVPPFVSASFDQLVESIVSVDIPSLVGSVASVATVLILGGFLTIFLLADSERGWASLMRGLDRRRARLLTVSVAVGRDRVGGFLRRTAVLALVDAVTVGLVLLVLGVPLAGPLVAATFILGFIPYVGGLVTALAVGLVVLASAGAAASVIALVAFVSVGIVAQRAIEGTSIGSRVDVHPVIVLAAIPAGAALFGVLGIVALLPMTVFLLVVGRSVVLALSMGSRVGAAPPPGVPIWLDRLAQWSWRGLIVIGVVAVVIAGIVRVPIVVIPAVLAAVLAATLAGPVARLRAAGWSSGRAALRGDRGDDDPDRGRVRRLDRVDRRSAGGHRPSGRGRRRRAQPPVAGRCRGRHRLRAGHRPARRGARGRRRCPGPRAGPDAGVLLPARRSRLVAPHPRPAARRTA